MIRPNWSTNGVYDINIIVVMSCDHDFLEILKQPISLFKAKSRSG